MSELISYLIDLTRPELESLLGDLFAPVCACIICSVIILAAAAVYHVFGLVLAAVFQRRWYR